MLVRVCVHVCGGYIQRVYVYKSMCIVYECLFEYVCSMCECVCSGGQGEEDEKLLIFLSSL